MPFHPILSAWAFWKGRTECVQTFNVPTQSFFSSQGRSSFFNLFFVLYKLSRLIPNIAVYGREPPGVCSSEQMHHRTAGGVDRPVGGPGRGRNKFPCSQWDVSDIYRGLLPHSGVKRPGTDWMSPAIVVSEFAEMSPRSDLLVSSSIVQRLLQLLQRKSATKTSFRYA